MYVGHAAVAMFAKGKRPTIPITLLVPIAFAPDWVEWIGYAIGIGAKGFSHSIVSVAIGATVAALVYWLVTRRGADAAVVWAVYASHWPADFITGIKPTWPGGPTVGLQLYSHPIADFVVESTLVVVCWLVYRRSLPVASRRRAINALVPLGLIAMQVVFEGIQNPRLL